MVACLRRVFLSSIVALLAAPGPLRSDEGHDHGSAAGSSGSTPVSHDPNAYRNVTPQQLARQYESIERSVRDRFSDGQGGLTSKGQDIMRILQNTQALPLREQAHALAHMQDIRQLKQAERELGPSPPRDQLAALQARFNENMTHLVNMGVLRGTSFADDFPAAGRPGPGGDRGLPPGAYEAAQGLGGNSPMLQSGLARSLLEYGSPGRAMEEGIKAIAMNPQSPAPYATVAKAGYELGDYRTAYEASRKALELDPGSREALSVYQLTKGRLGPSDAGVPASERPASAAPAVASAFRPFAPPGGTSPLDRQAAARGAAALEGSRHLAEASNYFRMKDYASAVEAARKAAEASPDSLDARRVEIGSLLRWGKYLDALRAADRALERFPDHPWLLTARAKALNMLRRHEEALASADRAVRVDPANAEAHLNRAWALDGMGGRRPEVMAALAKAAGLNPEFGAYLRAAQALGEGELAALLAGERPPEALTAKGGSRFGRLPRVLGMSLATLVGGLLVALGLVKLGSSSFRTKIRRSLANLSARSPAVGGMPARGGTPLPRAGDTPLNVGAYRLVRQIGTGGMGVVYEGLDRSLDRKVAVKKMREEIRSDPRERHRFLSEARTVAALRHPNIVEIFSVVEEGQDAYLVFEYVDGRTLSALLKDRRRLNFGEALEAMRGVCSALDYAHAKGVVHRDLKPSNIMVDSERNVKVMDFGVARQAKDSLSRLSLTNTVVGTPPYMAPEQEQGVVRRNSDVYALAVCFYEMVTGQLPFNGVGAGMLMVKLNKTYTPASHAVPNLPAGLDAVLDRALEPDPDKRTPTAGQFLKELEALLYAPRV